MRAPLAIGAVGALLCASAGPARGWWADGHQVMTQAAVRLLPDEVPAFFRQSADVLARGAAEPDLLREKDLSERLRDRERPEHFIDLELLQGRPLPPTRSAFLKLCAELRVAPHRVGMLPYAVAEWTERLAIAWAEHRKWPQEEAIQWKCRLVAATLAHYAQDLHQPLHLTIHYDGRVQPDGSRRQQGIHEKVDALVGRLGLTPDQIADGARLQPLPELWPGIVASLTRSRARIDEIYALEAELDDARGTFQPTERVRRLGLSQARAAAELTASLWLWAWRRSEALRLPKWLPGPEPTAPEPPR